LSPTLFLPVFTVARRIYNFVDGENIFPVANSTRKILDELIFHLPNQAELARIIPHLCIAVSNLPGFEAWCRAPVLFSWYSLIKSMREEAEGN